MRRGPRRALLGGSACLAAGACAVVLWPEAPPRASGAWMARAGVSPQHLDVGGRRVRYVRRGEGPAVVLLHGFGSSIYTWSEVLPALSGRFDVVAVDLPGFGGSDPWTQPFGAVVEGFVPAVLERLGLSRAHLVGNSLGGAVAALTAARHPQVVERLVLVDAAGYNLGERDRPAILQLVRALPEGMARVAARRSVVRLGLHQVFHDDALVTPERVEEYYAPLARPGATAAARAVLAEAGGLGLPAVLREVGAPTLVLWGREDAWIPVAHAELFVRDIPGARKVVLEECGHVPQEERPQEVSRLIAEFLAEAAPR